MGDRIKDKIAIVTGAGSVGPGIGNGKAAAMLFAREGASVMLVDYNLDAAEETKRLISEEGGTCFTSQADVSNSADCNRIASECIEKWGRIDILHNNVGIEIPGGILDITEDDWDRTLDVNLKSVFLMCRAVVPHMVEQGGGAIVNISSINGIRTLPALSGAYGASKLGMVALTREIAIEYASKGVRCNAVLPGMMRTPFVEASLTGAWGGDVEDMMRQRDAMIPIGKQGESWDVGHAALFLASDDAKYVTGTTLVVDGGLTGGVQTAG
jgi:NAD(P)-dependent dehydrogenase (short-subunit alcohol dehydrogenase family)